MGKTLRNLFNIYPEESTKACFFALLGFLASLGVICGSRLTEALFLLHVGAESLPTTYVATAIVAMVITAVLLWAYHHFSAYQIFLSILLIMACAYLVVLPCFVLGWGMSSPLFWFVLKVMGEIFFINLLTGFWSFVDQYHHLQDAKRLYALFASAAFLGVAVAGALIQTAFLSVATLLIFVISMLVISAFWTAVLARKVPSITIDHTSEDPEPKEQISLKKFIKAVLSSRIAVLLLSVDLVIQMLMWITEFNFMSAFEARLGSPDVALGTETAAVLTRFLGRWSSIVGVLNIVICLFVYNRLVKRFGVNNLEIITPVALILVFLAWPISHSLVVPLFGYFVVEGLNFVIDENNFNLLLDAVPNKIKYKFRVMVDFFFEPLGMLLSGPVIAMSHLYSRWVGLGLAIIGAALAVGIRHNYIKGMFINLADNAMRFHRCVIEWWAGMNEDEQRSSEERLFEALRGDSHPAQALACEALIARDDTDLFTRALPLLDAAPALTKEKFINLVDETPLSKDTGALEMIERWLLEDPPPFLRASILFFLAKHGLLNPDRVKQELTSNNLTLRAAAVMALQNYMPRHHGEEATKNHTLADEQMELLLHSQDGEEVRIGIEILRIERSAINVDTFVPYLKSEDSFVVRDAAHAIAHTIKHNLGQRRWIRYAKLIAALLRTSPDKETRKYCLDALGYMGDSVSAELILGASILFRPSESRYAEKIILDMGLRTVPMLVHLIKERSLHPRVRLLAGRILGKLAPAQLQTNLSTIIVEEVEQAYFYFYHAHRIQQQHPEYDLKMLEDSLKSSFNSVIEFIVQMIGVAGTLEDGEILSSALRSSNKKIRAQALETMEKCNPQIFELLSPLITDISLDNKLRAYLQGGRIPFTLSELLDILELSPTQIDNIMAATLKRRFNFSRWKDTLRKQMTCHHEVFHRCAYELLES